MSPKYWAPGLHLLSAAVTIIGLVSAFNLHILPVFPRFICFAHLLSCWRMCLQVQVASPLSCLYIWMYQIIEELWLRFSQLFCTSMKTDRVNLFPQSGTNNTKAFKLSRLFSVLHSNEETKQEEIKYLPIWLCCKDADAFLGHSGLLVCVRWTFSLSGVSQLTAREGTASRAPLWVAGPSHCSSWPFGPRFSL